MNNMHIGIFSDSINIPPKEGINVHTYNVACALARLPDVTVTLIVCDRGWLDLSLLDDQPFNTIVLPSTDFYDAGKIVQLISEHSLDVLHTYMVYFAAVVLGKASAIVRKPMCVEFHDLEKDVAPLYGLDEAEAAFNDSLQHQAGCMASAVRVMSAFDYAYVNRTWPELAGRTHWMPVSIPDPYDTDRELRHDGQKLLFIGNTSYPPNAAAARFIETSLGPALPEVHISLVGRGSERFSNANVQAYGMVDNIRDILQAHTLGLAPIFEGSGMKIKLLDYLSAGLPVVTTPLGAYGYPETEAIIIEEDTAKWPELLRKLLGDTADLRRRSVIARQTFLEHFDLDSNIRKLASLYRTLKFNPVRPADTFPDMPVRQADIYWLREVRETPRLPVNEQLVFKPAEGKK